MAALAAGYGHLAHLAGQTQTRLALRAAEIAELPCILQAMCIYRSIL